MNYIKQLSKIFSLTSSLFLLIAGCNIINPDETIPSYIYINEFSFTCDAAQGYPSEKILDGWVYANGQFIGAYQLPATVPVLYTGATDIIVYPGIKENGISGTGIIYPFYTGYQVTADLSEKETTTINPACTYKPGAETFIYLEDFEIGNSFFAINSEADMTVTYDPAQIFEGVRSGVATLSGEADTLRVSTGSIIFPTQDKLLFLEIDYKCDISYNIWINCNTLSGQTISSSVLTITAKEDWNKIYVNLNSQLAFFSEYQPVSYNLEFRATKPEGTDTASLYFDNLKIIRSN